MADPADSPRRSHFSLRDVPGTTIALTSLAILGAAAVLTTPVWLWYRRKMKRTDALVRQARTAQATPEEAGSPTAPESTGASMPSTPGDKA